MSASGIKRFLASSLVVMALPAAVQAQSTAYEIWGSDLSNSVGGQITLGAKGGYLYIFDSADVAGQMAGCAEALPLDCGSVPAPCDLNALFPAGLVEWDASGAPTGMTLGDFRGFARLHAVEHDPQGRYVALSLHGLRGGFVGIMDATTKQPLALFRATGTNADGGFEQRSVPTAYWNSDGSALIIANHDGKLLERIDVTRAAAMTGGTTLSLPQIEPEEEEPEADADAGIGIGRCVQEYRRNMDGTNGRPPHPFELCGRPGEIAEEPPVGEGSTDTGGDTGEDIGTGGEITGLVFNTSASLGMSAGLQVQSDATVFLGNGLIGTVEGTYDAAALGDLTPSGECKENGCSTGPNAQHGGRPDNLLNCPIISASDKAYVTFRGGGMLVVDTTATPMAIVGEYGNNHANGDGCGGAVVGDHVWFRAGLADSGFGAYASTFAVYRLDDTLVTGGAPNEPPIEEVYKDADNTRTGGNTSGGLFNTSGQLPGASTRQDARGMVATSGVAGAVPYVHVVNRIQNRIEVFNADTLARSSYDLVSADGAGAGDGACAAASVDDDPGLPANDPAPDAIATTPDGNLVVSLRGPAPVLARHAAQGSCPGIGVIDLSDDGSRGALAAVLRASNTTDSAWVRVLNGHAYEGAERADMRGVAVLPKLSGRTGPGRYPGPGRRDGALALIALPAERRCGRRGRAQPGRRTRPARPAAPSRTLRLPGHRGRRSRE